MYQNNPFQNMNNVISQFQQFKSSFQGDPKQKVMELLNSGKMSQSQFNQFQMLAKQLQGILGR